MYVPAAFAENERSKLQDFMERNSFALLVSQVEGRPFASHLPILLDRQTGPHGRLIGHMAKANSQWCEAEDQEVLVVFSGPHAYISPSWYEAQNVVPTWNYVAVHAYGRFQATHDPAALREIVRDSVALYERSMPNPWRLEETSAFIDKLLALIVGFRIEITRIEGKWKLSQNQPPERREKVAAALEQSTAEDSTEIARLIRRSALPG